MLLGVQLVVSEAVVVIVGLDDWLGVAVKLSDCVWLLVSVCDAETL